MSFAHRGGNAPVPRGRLPLENAHRHGLPPPPTLVTLPGIHAMQRWPIWIVWTRNDNSGQGPLTAEERTAEWAERWTDDGGGLDPDPPGPGEHGVGLRGGWSCSTCFHAADPLPERSTGSRRRRQAARGMLADTPVPKSQAEMQRMISAAKIHIAGRDIYYYNNTTGTRWLTCEEFAAWELTTASCAGTWRRSASMPAVQPVRQPEVDFFWPAKPSPPMAALRLRRVRPRPCGRLRRCGTGLSAVPAGLRRTTSTTSNGAEDVRRTARQPGRRGLRGDAAGPEPEFYMQIEWLPGGRIEEGELIFDPVWSRPRGQRNPELRPPCDEKARGSSSTSSASTATWNTSTSAGSSAALAAARAAGGRRDVYMAEMKQRAPTREIVKIIRMQKWGVWEHLDEGKSWNGDDRVGGVHRLHARPPAGLPPTGHESAGAGHPPEDHGDLRGRAERASTARASGRRTSNATTSAASPRTRSPGPLRRTTFALRFAALLGRAAAPNMIVGRMQDVEVAPGQSGVADHV